MSDMFMRPPPSERLPQRPPALPSMVDVTTSEMLGAEFKPVKTMHAESMAPTPIDRAAIGYAIASVGVVLIPIMIVLYLTLIR